MKLPNIMVAVVGHQKVADYLLSENHPVGRAKARFFRSFGFTRERAGELTQALRQHAEIHEVAMTEASQFGMRYIIDGILITPDGRNPMVRSVWFIETGEITPRFVTAYPAGRR